ncbi:hypothetical protein [Streptomyces sp. NPDC059881]|uniref:hypothetical protein n=1 Tax=Streptomyces sp. NPDC059881 TaxID=3346986 RepID=UPI0036569B57
MNGYAAVYEVVRNPRRSPAGVTGQEHIGTVHAAETDDSGEQPGPATLCGLATAAMPQVPGDRPTERAETWWPPVSAIIICAECDMET